MTVAEALTVIVQIPTLAGHDGLTEEMLIEI